MSHYEPIRTTLFEPSLSRLLSVAHFHLTLAHPPLDPPHLSSRSSRRNHLHREPPPLTGAANPVQTATYHRNPYSQSTVSTTMNHQQFAFNHFAVTNNCCAPPKLHQCRSSHRDALDDHRELQASDLMQGHGPKAEVVP
ncbi:unnamed protein product [Sphenostylis stenocarpa]|uniref:Uncharacterized protein n=1 Tax=Sphenostylis stenocarpa TaxID=92480 RepID=A0AA86S419_9FABA|nr:unnamed protein product [Sphenostylis stenocarpa]